MPNGETDWIDRFAAARSPRGCRGAGSDSAIFFDANEQKDTTSRSRAPLRLPRLQVRVLLGRLLPPVVDELRPPPRLALAISVGRSAARLTASAGVGLVATTHAGKMAAGGGG